MKSRHSLLAGFLYWRSVNWKEWGQRAKNAPEAKAQSIWSRIAVVLACALLYAFMCSPMLWHVRSANSVPGIYHAAVAAGVAMQWSGAVLQAVADHQKSAFKFSEAGKNRWCDAGLYASVRHPNYTGELMFWIGNFIAGLPAMISSGIWPVIPAGIGLSFINFLMNNQAKGQDEKQAARYGEDPEYKAWVQKTGSLFYKNWY